MATAMSRAKTLLRMPQGQVMTGYTPAGKQYFVNANAWTKTPKKGYVVYFYHASVGRVAHVGIVRSVGKDSFTTVEGNTSGQAYTRNGGMVASHTYPFSAIGSKVNGFGIPNFATAGVTADQFVSTAQGYLNYLEKASNKDLDSFTANAGNKNYQKFQRDVGAGNGDFWCQYFVSAIALYTCQKYYGAQSAAKPSAPAAPKSTAFDYHSIYDDVYYKKKYPDVAKAYGAKDAYEHFVTYGVNEQRIPCAKFDPKFYKAHNPDVAKYAGSDSAKLYQHYVNYVMNGTESRKGSAADGGKFIATVTADALNVRTTPEAKADGSNKAEFGPLAKGTQVTVANEFNGWYYINVTDKNKVRHHGFVAAKYMKRN